MKKLIFIALLSITSKLFAENVPHIDFVDLQREQEIKDWKTQQNNLPDSKRSRVGHFGGYVLLEKATKLTLGVYPVENGKVVPIHPKSTKKWGRSRELRIVFNNITYAYELGVTDSCHEPSYEVFQNTKNYILWIERCFSTSRRGEADNTFTHYVFDKKQKKVVMLLSTSFPINNPTLKLQNGIYKYRWIGRDDYENNFNYSYAFEIKPKDGRDITCHSDGCGDYLQLVPLLYKK